MGSEIIFNFKKAFLMGWEREARTGEKKNATLNCLQFNSNEVRPYWLSAHGAQQYKIAPYLIAARSRVQTKLRWMEKYN